MVRIGGGETGYIMYALHLFCVEASHATIRPVHVALFVCAHAESALGLQGICANTV